MKLDDIPFDDPETFALLSRGEGHGIFQISSPGMKGLLRSIQPSSLQDISAVLALYRPGALDNGFHTEFARKKHSGNHRADIHPELDDKLSEILASTYGTVVYQEQVMEIARVLAGYSLSQADNLRRAMGKKKAEVLAKEFLPFRRGMRGNGYSDEAVQAIWDVLLPFSDYAFNKSHSMGYAYLTYRGAYLKTHYPREYMSALLTRAKDVKELTQDIAEVRRMGTPLYPPSINHSKHIFQPTKNTTTQRAGIRYGLASIKGVGESAAQTILHQQPFDSLDRFFRSTDSSVHNAKVLETLVRAGAFEDVAPGRDQLLQQITQIAGLVARHRSELDAGQPTIIPVHYNTRTTASGQEIAAGTEEAGQAQEGGGRASARYREWERELLGAEFTTGRIVLNLSRPLSPVEWEWVVRTLNAQYRSQPVYYTDSMTGQELSLGMNSLFTHKLAEYMAGLGIRMVEE